MAFAGGVRREGRAGVAAPRRRLTQGQGEPMIARREHIAAGQALRAPKPIGFYARHSTRLIMVRLRYSLVARPLSGLNAPLLGMPQHPMAHAWISTGITR